VDAKEFSVFRPRGASEDHHPHACTDGLVFLTYTVFDEEVGDEVEHIEAVPCRRCADGLRWSLQRMGDGQTYYPPVTFAELVSNYTASVRTSPFRVERDRSFTVCARTLRSVSDRCAMDLPTSFS
jgi:hypothetical protein